MEQPEFEAFLTRVTHYKDTPQARALVIHGQLQNPRLAFAEEKHHRGSDQKKNNKEKISLPDGD